MTSISKEGKKKKVLNASGAGYNEKNRERIYRPPTEKAVELERRYAQGIPSDVVESHTWLVKEQKGEVASPKEEMMVPKYLHCSFCSEKLKPSILLPYCSAAACDECAMNSLIESSQGCQLFAFYLVTFPLLRKKVLVLRNKACGREDMVKTTERLPVPDLLIGNSVLPANIM